MDGYKSDGHKNGAGNQRQGTAPWAFCRREDASIWVHGITPLWAFRGEQWRSTWAMHVWLPCSSTSRLG